MNNIEEKKICEYGCGQEAKYQLKNGKYCCCLKFTDCQGYRLLVSERIKNEYKTGIRKNPFYEKSWNKGQTKETDYRLKKLSETLINGYNSGKLIKKSIIPTKETRDKISKTRSENLKKLGGGGFLSIKWYTVDNNGTEVTVRGTWELTVAEYLNKNNIKWEKGLPIKYLDENGFSHRYSPDFFLPEYNQYIEVKGYFSEEDKKKLDLIHSQHQISVIFINTLWYKKLQKEEVSLLEIPLYDSINVSFRAKVPASQKQIGILKKYYCCNCGKLLSAKTKTNMCVNCYSFSRRVVERPSKEALQELVETLPMTKIGKMFGVSDNAVKRWCKFYKIVIENRRGYWQRKQKEKKEL